MQVLRIDSFGSKEELAKKSNQATADYVEGLILNKKIKTVFANMSRTHIQARYKLLSRKFFTSSTFLTSVGNLWNIRYKPKPLKQIMVVDWEALFQ